MRIVDIEDVLKLPKVPLWLHVIPVFRLENLRIPDVVIEWFRVNKIFSLVFFQDNFYLISQVDNGKGSLQKLEIPPNDFDIGRLDIKDLDLLFVTPGVFVQMVDNMLSRYINNQIDFSIMARAIIVYSPNSIPEESLPDASFPVMINSRLKQFLLKNKKEEEFIVLNGLTIGQESQIFNSWVHADEDGKKVLNQITESTRLQKFAEITIIKPEDNHITFSGYSRLKEELKYIRANFRDEVRTGAYFLIGPPGTGKSQFAKYVAKELQVPYIQYDPSMVLHHLLGQSEHNLKQLLDYLEKSSGVVFALDEVFKVLGDARNEVTGVHRHLIGMIQNFLQERKNPKCIIFMTSNVGIEDSLDAALIRAIRSELVAIVDYPSEESRRELIRDLFEDIAINELNNLGVKPNIFEYIRPDEFEEIVDMTKDFSGAEIRWLIKRSLREFLIDSTVSFMSRIDIYAEVIRSNKNLSLGREWSPPKLPFSGAVLRVQ